MLDAEEGGQDLFSSPLTEPNKEMQVVATLKIDQVALASNRELVSWESVADLLSAARNN